MFKKQISTTLGVLILVFLVGGVIGITFFLLDFDGESNIRKINLADKREAEKDREIKYIGEGIEGREIQVIEGEEVFYSITISELNEWLEDNQDIFKDIPKIVDVEMTPRDFTFFDGTASLSPCNLKLAFSTHKYAYLIETSYIFIVDLEKDVLSGINTPVTGAVEGFSWSKDAGTLAYSLGTARVGGEYLAVDDLSNFERNFLLSRDDILQYLEIEEAGDFMPLFRKLEWDGDYLNFTTNHPQGGDIEWVISKKGEGLQNK